MLNSSERIQVTTAGSLPRTDQLLQANAAIVTQSDGLTPIRTPEHDALLASAVSDIVLRQRDAGVTFPGDGEYGKAMSADVDYGAWWHYSFARLGGLELSQDRSIFEQSSVRSTPGHVALTSFNDRRDRAAFPRVYNDGTTADTGHRWAMPVVTGPIIYRGQDLIARDVSNLKAALAEHGFDQGFITSIAPASASRIGNIYYQSEEEFLFALADALHSEYKAITDAGLVVQIDDPFIAEAWDQINPEPSVQDYLAFLAPRVEALNYALRDIPEDQIRFHLCWGSWHGPHTTDIEFKYLVDLMLSIRAGAYSFEAGNVRHEHEWTVWREAKLPDDKLILPGVVSHATNVVEHPDLVAQRLERFASLVGKERVIASTDCGLGGRVHPDIAVDKVRALGEGARRLTSMLY